MKKLAVLTALLAVLWMAGSGCAIAPDPEDKCPGGRPCPPGPVQPQPDPEPVDVCESSTCKQPFPPCDVCRYCGPCDPEG